MENSVVNTFPWDPVDENYHGASSNQGPWTIKAFTCLFNISSTEISTQVFEADT